MNFLEDLKEKELDPLKVNPAQVSANIGSTTDSTILTLGQKLQDTEFLFSPRIDRQWQLWSRVDDSDRKDDKSDQRSFNDFMELYLQPPAIFLSQRDVTRWKFASRAAQAIGKDIDHGNHPNSIALYLYRNFSLRCEDWPNLDDVLNAPFLQLGFVLAALVYGGLHALAWFAHFNTSTEQLLWRISACIVMGGLPVAFGLLALIKPLVKPKGWSRISWYSFKYYGFKDSITRICYVNSWRNWGRLGICIMVHLLYLVGIVYALARAYLVVECFISLAHLPAGVYDVPQWAAYFPNIS